MTDMRKVNEAVKHMQGASSSVDEWCMRMTTQKTYRYHGTHIYHALKALEAGAKTVPPRPSKPLLPTVQRCLFLTDDVTQALDCRARLLIATADLTYRHNYTSSFVQQAIAEDRFRVWCDCRPAPDGTPPQVALQWLSELGLPPSYFYGQGESADEFQRGYDAGARKFVVNISALNDEQIGRVASGECLVTNETYFNKDRNYTVNWRNANAGIGGNCMAVYESSSEGASYYSLEDQARDNKYNPATDCVYVAGFHSADWAYLITH